MINVYLAYFGQEVYKLVLHILHNNKKYITYKQPHLYLLLGERLAEGELVDDMWQVGHGGVDVVVFGPGLDVEVAGHPVVVGENEG